MYSNIRKLSFQNLSLSVYIGNVSSFDDQILIDYCSQYGKVVSCSIGDCPPEKQEFCDYRLIEFSTKRQLEYFLGVSIHKIGSVILDVKLYDDLSNESIVTNTDRKLFVGPIFNSTYTNKIVQFYRNIDQNLKYTPVQQAKLILIEFTNRQSVRTVIEQNYVFKTVNNKTVSIHTAVNPKRIFNKSNLITNNPCQIYVRGLTNHITDEMLIEYFNKRAPIIAYQMMVSDPTGAIIEFENEKDARKLLETHHVRAYGATLLLSRLPCYVMPVVTLTKSTTHQINMDNEVDELLEADINLLTQKTQNDQSSGKTLDSTNKNRWTSPPRNVVNQDSRIDRNIECSASKLRMTSINIMNKNPSNASVNTIFDMKPIKIIANNKTDFTKQFEDEINQIKDKYTKKYTEARIHLTHEINRLANDERITLDKIDRYFYNSK